MCNTKKLKANETNVHRDKVDLRYFTILFIRMEKAIIIIFVSYNKVIVTGFR